MPPFVYNNNNNYYDSDSSTDDEARECNLWWETYYKLPRCNVCGRRKWETHDDPCYDETWIESDYSDFDELTGSSERYRFVYPNAPPPQPRLSSAHRQELAIAANRAKEAMDADLKRRTEIKQAVDSAIIHEQRDWLCITAIFVMIIFLYF